MESLNKTLNIIKRRSMKITHVKNEVSEEIIDLNNPIQRLTVSDPNYTKDVWCRYQNNNLNLNNVAIAHETTIIEDDILGEDKFDIIRLLFRESEKSINRKYQETTYQIGVDTAKYCISTNLGGIKIDTDSDGIFGRVYERVVEKGVREIELELSVPDNMEVEQFIKDICEPFRIGQFSMVVIRDEDVVIDLNEGNNMELN